MPKKISDKRVITRESVKQSGYFGKVCDCNSYSVCSEHKSYVLCRDYSYTFSTRHHCFIFFLNHQHYKTNSILEVLVISLVGRHRILEDLKLSTVVDV